MVTDHPEGGFLIPETIRAELLSSVIAVPNELMADAIRYAFPRTDEERDIAAQRRDMAKQARTVIDTQAQHAHTALVADAASDQLAVDILTLHHPHAGYLQEECAGCDYEGYEGEPPEWPCRTYQLIAERYGRRFTEGNYGTTMETT